MGVIEQSMSAGGEIKDAAKCSVKAVSSAGGVIERGIDGGKVVASAAAAASMCISLDYDGDRQAELSGFTCPMTLWAALLSFTDRYALIDQS